MSVLDDYLTADQMELYLLSLLGEEEAEAVEVHLLVCEQCRRRFTKAEDEIAALRLALLER